MLKSRVKFISILYILKVSAQIFIFHILKIPEKYINTADANSPFDNDLLLN